MDAATAVAPAIAIATVIAVIAVKGIASEAHTITIKTNHPGRTGC